MSRNTASAAVLLVALLLSPTPRAQTTQPNAPPEAVPSPAPAGAAPTPAAEAAVNNGPAAPVSAGVAAAVGSPEPGKGLVVFFRPGRFMGGGVGFKVRENEQELGKLTNARWFAIQVEPGQHTYVVHSEAKDVTTIEVEAGETYFLMGTMTMGVVVYHPNLSPSDAATFEATLPKLKKAKPLN